MQCNLANELDGDRWSALDAIKGRGADDINAAYLREPDDLTADKWLSKSDDGGQA